MTKKRLILMAGVGVVALATISVTLTLAWYGASDSLRVNYFDLGITGDQELKISTSPDLDSFKESLSSEELKADLPNDFRLHPVSSMNKDNWMSQEKDAPIFYAPTSALTPDFMEASNDFYFSKKLYLLLDDSYNVTLDIDKCVFENDDNSNLVHAQEQYALHKDEENFNLTINDIKDGLDNLINCLRVSILVNVPGHYNYYIIDPKKGTQETVFAGLLDNDGDGYYDTHEELVDGVYQTLETVYGEMNNRQLIKYNNPVSNTDSSYTHVPNTEEFFYGNCFNGVSRSTAYTYNQEASFANGLKFAKEESLSLDDIRNHESAIEIPCYKNEPTEIVVSYYLEGWDRECINATMGASFDTKLSFKLSSGGIIHG
ncbi:MAG: hypothetical protein J6T25_04355 [Bacilli bacterium]|nr:hypothetical protein [Bacilli bacterium]